uniref:C3H1-type domain-containing protein n=1 Tax=Steinernema glaseri TaxID=37863 RepID=A0A1I7Y0C0_9BILA
MDAKVDSTTEEGKTEAPSAPPCTFFKRPTRKRLNARTSQKSSGESDEGDDDLLSANIAELKRKRQRHGKITSTTVKEKKDSDESDPFDSDTQDDDGPGCSSQVAQAHISNAHNSALTELSEIDTPFDRDAQAQFERIQSQLKDGFDPKIYKGAALYNATIKEDSVKGNASSGLVRLGPMRANQFIKRTIRWDFAPDVCKDYKETGFCTFGDSCKFMHDRSDYKHGWEIERDYQEGTLKEEDDDKYKRRKCPISECAKAWTGNFKYAKDLEKHLKEKAAKEEEDSDADDKEDKEDE